MPLRKPKPPPCAHQWTVIGAAYRPPVDFSRFRVANVDDDLIGYTVFGFTSITQRCTLCGWTDVRKHQGKVSVPGFHWEADTQPGSQRTYPKTPGGRPRIVPLQ